VGGRVTRSRLPTVQTRPQPLYGDVEFTRQRSDFGIFRDPWASQAARIRFSIARYESFMVEWGNIKRNSFNSIVGYGKIVGIGGTNTAGVGRPRDY
jgi:hypothetical protein